MCFPVHQLRDPAHLPTYPISCLLSLNHSLLPLASPSKTQSKKCKTKSSRKNDRQTVRLTIKFICVAWGLPGTWPLYRGTLCCRKLILLSQQVSAVKSFLVRGGLCVQFLECPPQGFRLCLSILYALADTHPLVVFINVDRIYSSFLSHPTTCPVGWTGLAAERCAQSKLHSVSVVPR